MGFGSSSNQLGIDDFHGEPGPQLPDDFDTVTATPLEYFLLIFPVQLIQALVAHTNAYSVWKIAQNGPDDRWDDVTFAEMRAFLGINILMGISQLPHTEMYWSTNPFFGNAGVQRVMTCNRFQKISQYFHASDRSAEVGRGLPGYDKLYKVRSVMDVLLGTFRRYYTLSRVVAVDEAMVKYTGRLSFRQYMPAKPIKRGIKVWMLCDSANGYLAKLEMFLVFVGFVDT
ncbi:PGBD4-like protein [Mya arenaria]|uniref:PGBD4-like protein n=1 Tax=Mya arenaria TaxID=6604 RepID=A0ABY7G234_MYAAR|nr:PGBD4-like protein [Mya arenaria]